MAVETPKKLTQSHTQPHTHTHTIIHSNIVVSYICILKDSYNNNNTVYMQASLHVETPIAHMHTNTRVASHTHKHICIYMHAITYSCEAAVALVTVATPQKARQQQGDTATRRSSRAK